MSDVAHINNHILKQIAVAVKRHFECIDHTLTVRVRDGNASEVVKFITVNTDASVRMSTLKNRMLRDGTRSSAVHIKMEKFISAFDDEVRAGTNTVRILDVLPQDRKSLSEDELNSIVAQIAEHITLKASNVRKPRTRYPVIEGTDQAKDNWCAGSFKVTKVDVYHKPGTTEIERIVLHGAGGLNQQISGKAAARIVAPERMVGCRVVTHASGVVRVLRETKFETIYEIVGKKEV